MKDTKRKKIIRNAAVCMYCNDLVESFYVHDFVICKCGSIFVDGGLEYLRRGGDIEKIIDLSETEECDEV